MNRNRELQLILTSLWEELKREEHMYAFDSDPFYTTFKEFHTCLEEYRFRED